MTCGIYRLYWDINNRSYIGQSIAIEKSRWPKHKDNFKAGTHTKKLQSIFDSLGLPNMEILEECLPEDLDAREAYWIRKYDSIRHGFNVLDPEALSSSMKGEENGSSKYKNTDYACVLFMLVYTKMPVDEISKHTGVSKRVILRISQKVSHSWLKEAYPIEYALLVPNRSYNSLKAPSVSVLSPEGVVYHIHNRKEFADTHGLTPSSLSKLLNGQLKSHKKWTLKRT